MSKHIVKIHRFISFGDNPVQYHPDLTRQSRSIPLAMRLQCYNVTMSRSRCRVSITLLTYDVTQYCDVTQCDDVTQCYDVTIEEMPRVVNPAYDEMAHWKVT